MAKRKEEKMESPAMNVLSYVRASSGAPPNKDCREAPRNALIGHQWALRMHGFETVGRKLIENPWR